MIALGLGRIAARTVQVVPRLRISVLIDRVETAGKLIGPPRRDVDPKVIARQELALTEGCRLAPLGRAFAPVATPNGPADRRGGKA